MPRFGPPTSHLCRTLTPGRAQGWGRRAARINLLRASYRRRTWSV